MCSGFSAFRFLKVFFSISFMCSGFSAFRFLKVCFSISRMCSGFSAFRFLKDCLPISLICFKFSSFCVLLHCFSISHMLRVLILRLFLRLFVNFPYTLWVGHFPFSSSCVIFLPSCFNTVASTLQQIFILSFIKLYISSFHFHVFSHVSSAFFIFIN